MAASHECARRGVDSWGVSLVSISACSGAGGVVVLNTVTDAGFARRAGDLDAEAAYLRRPAPGHCTDRAALARRIRTGKAAPRGCCYVAQVLGERMSFTDHSR
jgi:hypothetical protein